MKKMIAAVAAVLLIVLCAGTAFAQGKEYSLPELNLTVMLPDGYLVLTDETLDDAQVQDTLYDWYGLDAEAVRDSFEEQDIYLDALEMDGENEFMISMTRDEEDSVPSVATANFNQILIEDLRDSPEYVDQQVEYFKSADYAEWTGGEVADVKKVSTDDALYISYHVIVEVDGIEYDELHYMTVTNGQYMDFVLRENGGSITPEHEQMMEEIMGSVKIEQVDNEVSRKIVAQAQASTAGVIIGIVLAAIVVLGSYIKYKKRLSAEQAQANQMASLERDTILRNNAAEQAKYLVGRLTVMRDEGAITQEEYERKVGEIGKRG